MRIKHVLGIIVVAMASLAFVSQAVADITWSVKNLALDVVVCKNKTNGTKVRLDSEDGDAHVPLAGSCGELGLTWNAGDDVQVKVIGNLTDGFNLSQVGGSVQGIATNVIICKNRTRGERVRQDEPDDGWDWGRIRPSLFFDRGDRMQWKARGSAQPEGDISEFKEVRAIADTTLTISHVPHVGDDDEDLVNHFNRCEGSTQFAAAPVSSVRPADGPSVPARLVAAARDACNSFWIQQTQTEPPAWVQMFNVRRDPVRLVGSGCGFAGDDFCGAPECFTPVAGAIWESQCSGHDTTQRFPPHRVLAVPGVWDKTRKICGEVPWMTELRTTVTVDDVEIALICDVGNQAFAEFGDPPLTPVPE